MVQVYALDITNLLDPLECPKLMEELAEERKQKIMKCKQLQARKQSLGAGLLLRYVLRKNNIDADAMRLGNNGKPEVEGIFFNLSHSESMVVCAVSDKPIGCDIERIAVAPAKIAERFFCEGEIRYLKQFSEEEKNKQFYRLWTIKESYMKMTGEGMRLPLNQFELLFEERIKIYRDGKIQDCFVKEYEVPEYKLTVCAEEEEFSEKVILKQWEELVR